MKNVLIICFLLLNHTILANYCWESKANVGINGRHAAMGFELNGKGYVGCGYNSGGTNDFWEFDPIANTWTQKANYTGGNVWAGVGFSIGSKGYMGLGTSGSAWPSTIYEYNPSNNSWTAKASLPNGIQDCFGFSINNNGYVVCGWRSGTYYNTLYKFDPVANTWTSQASFPGMARDGIRGFTIGNDAYAGTGNRNGTTYSDFYKYNSLTNTWTSIANLPGNSRHSAIGFQINNKGFFGAGSNSSNSVNFTDIYEYNSTNNTWMAITPFPGNNISYSVTFSTGINGYVATGRKVSVGQNYKETWKLTESSVASFQIDSVNCQNTAFLSNLSTNASYSLWYFGDGTISNQTSPHHTYASTGTYTISLVTGSGSCKDSTTLPVTVSNTSNTAFSVTSNPCDLTILTTNTSTGFSNYQWNWGDGNQSTGLNPNHTYSATGTYQISLIGSNGVCTDTAHYTLVLTQNLSTNATISNNCNGLLTVTSFATNGTNVIWDWGDGTTTNGNASNHQYNNTGNYNVLLITSTSSCIDTIPFSFNYSNNLQANFNVTSDCHQNINITDNSTGGTQYQWIWGDGNTSNINVSTHHYQNSGPYVIYQIVSNGTCSDTTSQTITITPELTPVSYNTNLGCNFDLSISNLNYNGNNLAWYWGDNSTSSGTQTYHIFPDSGNYTIQTISSNANCSDTSYTIVHINEPIASSFTVQKECKQNIILNNASTANVTYHWDMGNGSILSGNLSSYTYPQPGNYTVTLIATSGICSDTSYQNIQIDSTINVQFSASTDCNNNVQLINSSANTQNYNINWGDGNISSSLIPIHQYLNSGSYQIKIIGTNQNCIDSTTLSVVCQTISPAAINYSFNSCKDSVSLSSQNTALQYLWNLGDGTTSNLQSLVNFYPLDSLYSITLITSNQQCSDTSTINIQLPGTPNSNFTITNNCSKTIDLNPESNSQFSYLWNFGDLTSSTNSNEQHTFNNQGNYSIKLLVSNGFCQDSTVKNIEIYDEPIYNISYSIDSCSRDVFFKILPLATNSYWQFGDGVTSTGNTALHHYTNEATFNVVTIIDQGSVCADTIITVLDLSNVSLINDLYIPNCFTPNSDLKNDSFVITGNGCSQIKMKIFNRWGNLIFETTDLEHGWNGKVDDTDCPEGIYLLLLQNETIKRSGFITLIR